MLKVDIEGAEISALKRGSNKLNRLLKVTVEVHCDNLLTAKKWLEQSHLKLQMTDKPGIAEPHRIEVTKPILK